MPRTYLVPSPAGQALWVKVSLLLGASVLKGLYEPVSLALHVLLGSRN